LFAVALLVPGIALAHSFTIHQVNWLSDKGGYLVKNSEWGTVNIQFVPGDEAEFQPCGDNYCGYVQVITSDGITAAPNWAVANMPLVIPSGGFDGRLPDSFAFNLGLPRGFDAGLDPYYSAAVVITPMQLNSPPPILLALTAVTQEDWLWGNGYAGEVIPPTAQNFVLADAPADEVVTATLKIKEDDVVVIAEEINRCGPGSAARSLKYLAAQKLIEIKQSSNEVYDTLKGKKYMDTDPVTGTTGDNFCKGKNAYATKFKVKVQTGATATSPFIVDEVIKPMKDGAGVEISFDKGKNGDKSLGNHLAFVSEIQLTRDPKTEDVKSFKVKILDDPKQDGKTMKNRSLWLNFKVTKKGTDPEVITLDGWGKDATLNQFWVEIAGKDPEEKCGLLE
jgi:hypothetical protein